MKVFKIDPVPQQTFYVVANENEDLSKIADERICFSPVTFTIEEVDIGEIPDRNRIILCEGGWPPVMQEIDKETAHRIVCEEGLQEDPDAKDLPSALEELAISMESAGLAIPMFIQLIDVSQALAILESFRYMYSNSRYTQLRSGIALGKINTITIYGIELRWQADDLPPDAHAGPRHRPVAA